MQFTSAHLRITTWSAFTVHTGTFKRQSL